MPEIIDPQPVQPNDNTKLLGELEAAKRQIADLESGIMERDEKLSSLSGAAEKLELYTSHLGSQFEALYNEQPDYIKEHLGDFEAMKADPLGGINHITEFKAFAETLYKQKLAKEADDPTSKPPAHGGDDKPVALGMFSTFKSRFKSPE